MTDAPNDGARDGRLVIGTKRYSSWSLRGWLAVRLAGLDVAEQVIPLAGGGGTAAVKAATPAGMVPFLEHRGARVWESLAVVEYCAEFAPLWPEDRVRRAMLRSAATEMHGGFGGLRRAFPTVMGARAAAGARDALATPDALADLARVAGLWEALLWHSGGPFLHGAALGGADAMFAPVASRILTWDLAVPPSALRYAESLHAHPLLRRWHDEAAAEPAEWRLDHYERRLLAPGAEPA